MNYIDETGLHLQTRDEIVTELENQFKAIYGADISLAPNSPDRQMIEIFAQAKMDILELAADVYASFNPDEARGRVLDARGSINGVARSVATYTKVMVNVTLDREVALKGADNFSSPFTVANGSGTQFYLEESQTLPAGVHSLSFRAAELGAVDVTAASLTTIVSVTLGVTATSNPAVPYQSGVNEETDSQFRTRRRAAVALPSQGYLQGIQGALRAVDGVTDCVVYENVTTVTDAFGIPGHSMWAIVDGGDEDEIAQTIYVKRNAGCGMRGDEVVAVPQVNGTALNVRFDRPVYADLHMKFTVTSLTPLHAIDAEYLKNKIFEQIVYGIYQPADLTAITTLLKSLDPLIVVTTGGVSGDDVTYESYLYPDTIQTRWLVSTSRIDFTVI